MFVAMTDDEPKPSKNWLHFRDVWISTQPGLSGRGGLWHLVAIPHFQSALPRRYLLQAPAIVSLSWLFLSMMMAVVACSILRCITSPAGGFSVGIDSLSGKWPT